MGSVCLRGGEGSKGKAVGEGKGMCRSDSPDVGTTVDTGE